MTHSRSQYESQKKDTVPSSFQSHTAQGGEACATTGCQNWTPEVESSQAEGEDRDGWVGRSSASFAAACIREMLRFCLLFFFIQPCFVFFVPRHYFPRQEEHEVNHCRTVREGRKNDGAVEVEDERGATERRGRRSWIRIMTLDVSECILGVQPK